MRKTAQHLLPLIKPAVTEGKYDIFPSFITGDNQVCCGFDSLTKLISRHKIIVIDGFGGVFFNIFREEIGKLLAGDGLQASWITTESLFRTPGEIKKLISPFLGGNDPLFGSLSELSLIDYFDPEKLAGAKPDPHFPINIIIGPGAALAGWEGLLVYIDLQKNEIQYRARAGSIANLGMSLPVQDKAMYKQFYFADWPVLNRHKQKILPSADIFVDGQRPEMPVWMEGAMLRESLHSMSRSMFRARPWFEPGAWGGTWIKDNISGLNTDVPNYAWSFELITPENGLLIESSSVLLEISFDSIMYLEGEAVLGSSFSRHGHVFPIRFDFLDTFSGGNLSLQCHPRPDYIKTEFGENFTQEETYYILDAGEDSGVYLGFAENTGPSEFRSALEKSQAENTELDCEKYILKHPSKKHDLFLIPYGTIHGSGKNNLVLEISTTPYIYTFKMYDWLRPDLDGKPRPLNIERGMENLYFERRGKYVWQNLISRPLLIDSGKDWKLYELPTHETHSYEIRRYHFMSEITIPTGNKCFVMNLTGGASVRIETENGSSGIFSFAETFVIPAAAGRIKAVNNSDKEAVLVYAYMK